MMRNKYVTQKQTNELQAPDLGQAHTECSNLMDPFAVIPHLLSFLLSLLV